MMSDDLTGSWSETVAWAKSQYRLMSLEDMDKRVAEIIDGIEAIPNVEHDYEDHWLNIYLNYEHDLEALVIALKRRFPISVTCRRAKNYYEMLMATEGGDDDRDM